MTSQSPMEATERRRSILYIAIALILAIALGGGLVKVGAGFAARNANGITVTGSAKTSATADNVVWTLNVSLTSTQGETRRLNEFCPRHRCWRYESTRWRRR